jgi:hypothetical protein
VGKRGEGEMVALLDSLLTHAPIGFAFFDRNYRYLRVNDFLAEINGVRPTTTSAARCDIVPVDAPFVSRFSTASSPPARPSATWR